MSRTIGIDTEELVELQKVINDNKYHVSGIIDYIGTQTTQQQIMAAFEYEIVPCKPDHTSIMGYRGSRPIIKMGELVGWYFSERPPRYPDKVVIDFTKPKESVTT